MKRSRAEKAGRALGRAIVEMINLMYQTNIARNFFMGLTNVLADKNAERLWELPTRREKQ